MINAHSQSTPRAFCWLFVAAVGLQFFPSPVRAEETAKPSPSSLPKVTAAELGLAGSPAPAAGASQTPTPLPKVTKVEVEEGDIELYHTLAVECDGLKEWVQKTGTDPAKLLLYLDGTAMKGLPPKYDQINANKLFFKLERVSSNDGNKDDNSKAWDSLFSTPPKGVGQRSPVRVTIGPETGAPFESSRTATICPINPEWFWLWVLFSVLLLGGICALAFWTDLLRDSGDQPKDGKRKPYSLARCQMAFWFFLIVVAYLFIYATAGATDTVTPSVLALMGISAGTGLAAVAVDNSKRAQAQTELDKLTNEQAKLQGQKDAATVAARLNELPGLIATQQASVNSADNSKRVQAQAELDKLQAEQAKLQGQQQAAAVPGGATFPPESLQRLNDLPRLIAALQAIVDPKAGSWFIQDILSDADAISFHRLQIAVWTVVLGIIFGVSVYHVLSMPTFSATLLGLLGISGGTYIGFKIPEQL